MGFMGSSAVSGPTTVGKLVGRAGSQISWLPGPALCSGYQRMGQGPGATRLFWSELQTLYHFIHKYFSTYL